MLPKNLSISRKKLIFQNLSRLYHCSVIKVLLSFFVVALRDSFYILSHAFSFVNHFF